MDDLNKKIAGIINDPESMANLKNMAENLLSGSDSKNNNNTDNMPPIENLETILAIISKFNSKNEDDRSRLLNALKPYLSERRQVKAENAIKILKLLELWPLIKESGMFNI